MCDHSPTPADARRGASLDDGADAHARDHVRWNRRDFLTRMGLGTLGASFLAGATPIGVFAHAPALDLLAALETDRVLVLVQLAGGNDGLNTVVPLRNDEYVRRRTIAGVGSIAIPASRIAAAGTGLSDDWGLHPAMAALLPLVSRDDLAVVHSVGYGNGTSGQSRSHFEGTDNWFTGSGGATGGAAVPRFSDGWAGRYLVPEVAANPAIYAESPPAISLGAAQRLFDTANGNLGVGRLSDSTTAQALLRRLSADPTAGVFPLDGIPAGQPFSAPVDFLRRQANLSLDYVVRFVKATNPATTPNRVTYPNTSFAANLALAARTVRGGLSPRIISVSLGGFDTHAGQAVTTDPATGTHATLLKTLADGLAAFFADLAADGLDRRVVAMTFSEFGRTLNANVSGGTDHGSASPVILAGSAIDGGLFGTAPTLVTGLTGTGSGAAPTSTTDYRSLYATLLERWFSVPAASVDQLLGAGFARLGVLPATATGAEGAAAQSAPALLAPTPNPFTDYATLRLRLPAPMPVRIVLFDATGRRIAVLFDGPADAGESTLPLDGSALAPGMYVVRMETPRGATSRPVVRVR